jgi:hypothetical protein
VETVGLAGVNKHQLAVLQHKYKQRILTYFWIMLKFLPYSVMAASKTATSIGLHFSATRVKHTRKRTEAKQQG